MNRTMIKLMLLIFATILTISSGGGDGEPDPDGNIDSRFKNPREISITGYSGHAMEPFISKDGEILFFNNLNSPTLSDGTTNDTDIHYARRIDTFTFQYQGEIQSANTDNDPDNNELEAVASLDNSGKFYYTNTINYFIEGHPGYLISIYSADYVSGQLQNIEPLSNLKMGRPPGETPVTGELNMDVEINAAGDVLIFTENIFSGSPLPDTSNIGMAAKVGGVFEVLDNSVELMENINTDALEYAPSISVNMLELYFTRITELENSTYDFSIYLSTRNSTNESWGTPQIIEAIEGEATEAPSITSDGRILYYHMKMDGIHKIYCVSRDI